MMVSRSISVTAGTNTTVADYFPNDLVDNHNVTAIVLMEIGGVSAVLFGWDAEVVHYYEAQHGHMLEVPACKGLQGFKISCASGSTIISVGIFIGSKRNANYQNHIT